MGKEPADTDTTTTSQKRESGIVSLVISTILGPLWDTPTVSMWNLELILWIVFAIITSGRLLVERSATTESWQFILSNFYTDITISLLIILFPIAFKLVFGLFPFGFLREKHQRYLHARDRMARANLANGDNNTVHHKDMGLNIGVDPGPDGNDHGKTDSTKVQAAEQMLSVLAQSSQKLARNLYTRAGLYLLTGVLIAFSGLEFFYLETAATSGPSSVTWTDALQKLAPRFGVLFFIELVAFFFLKQYQTAMDEFRHYEAIKRHREDNLVIIALLSGSPNSPDPLKVVEVCAFHQDIGRLASGESTELLESLKARKDELAVFERIVDAVGKPGR